MVRSRHPRRRRAGFRSRFPDSRPQLESLEDRLLLSFQPTLLKDTNLTPQGSSILPVATIGNVQYFTADDGLHNSELWRSDGTTAGTDLLQDINPTGSTEAAFPTNVNGTLFFLAGLRPQPGPSYYPAGEYELWRSDGTAAGTQLLLDAARPPFVFVPDAFFDAVDTLTPFNNRLFFEVYTASTGHLAPWISDGTPAGTFPLKNIDTFSAYDNTHVFPNAAVVNGKLFFGATDGTGGGQLWVTDGTPVGTQMVKDTNPADPHSRVDHFMAAGNLVYFFAADQSEQNQQLWRSDGTAAGTFPLTVATNVNYDLGIIPAGDGTAYFVTSDSSGQVLWHTDGTLVGTVPVKTGVTIQRYANGTWTTAGNLFYFEDQGGVLWRSDGTVAGTFSLGVRSPYFAATVGSTVYFAGDDRVHGRELWRTDGTPAGTVLVKDINPTGSAFAGNSGPALVRVGTDWYFDADDGVHGVELWKTDGSTAGTVLVKDINPTGGSDPWDLTALGNTLIFVANDGTHSRGLWKSDGTDAGTSFLLDVAPGTDTTDPSFMTAVNGVVLFTAFDAAHASELWRTDGTPAGTALVRDVNPGTQGIATYSWPPDPTFFFAAGPTVYFFSNHGLWRSDGTDAGTVLVEQFQGESALTSPYYQIVPTEAYRGALAAAVGNTLYFAMDDGVHGRELWKSDGTPAGTQLVADIVPGADGSWPTQLTNVNGTLFFTVDVGTLGRELWTSDGTAAGTRLVRDILNPGSSNPEQLLNDNGVLLFSADDGEHGRELWRSDGTVAGTLLVRDVNLTTSNYFPPDHLTLIGDTVYFTEEDTWHGTELWKTDGTYAGTTLVADLTPGVDSTSFPGTFAVLNGTLYFTALTGPPTAQTSGLWKSDGTAAGTVLVTSPGAENLIAGNGFLYFTRDAELWRSDGTAAGTVRVTTVDPNPTALSNVGGSLFFTTDNPSRTGDSELWRSDGTAGGTVLETLNPEGASSPYALTGVGSALYFFANDGLHGNEPWSQQVPTPNEKLVLRLYEDLLHREADEAGLAAWNAWLDQGVSAEDVARGMEQTPEYRTQALDRLYVALLDRGLDPAGQAAGLDFLAAGGKLEQIRNSILASPEYLAGHGHGTTDGFLRVLYQDLLGRGNDPVGLQNWEAQMAGGLSRAGVVDAVAGSDESLQHEVDHAYAQMLHRPADPGGETGWAGYLAAGHGTDDLLAALASSKEYLLAALTQSR
jgi:ELWxxDGT repeat protein